MRKTIIILAASAVSLSACAKRPDAIAPIDIPMAAYQNQDCGSLAQEYMKEQTTLAALSKQQNDAANGDAFGVFLIGVPMSSTFGGDKEGKVAVSKGKLQSIENNMKSKRCDVPQPVVKKS
jgi:hypothetical protein